MSASEKGIDLDSMSLEQLNSLKQTEESRMNAITSHYATLRASKHLFPQTSRVVVTFSY